MPITAVLFDLDDTLTDAAHFGASVLVAAAEEHGHALDLEVVQQYPGAPYAPLLERLLRIHHSEATTIYATYVRRYRVSMPDLQPVHGAGEAIAHLAERGVRLGLVTNKLEQLAHEILAQFVWDAHFGTVVGQDSCAYRKPHPGPALQALAALDVEPGTAAFVGDTVGDMQCASGAGIATVIGLLSTTSASDLARAGATHTCADFDEVLRTVTASA